MLKSLIQGYIPAILLAVLGNALLGGSFFAWMVFVWVAGAVLTIAVAVYKTPVPSAQVARSRPIVIDGTAA